MSNDTTKEVNNRQPPELEEQEINLLDLLLVLARRWKMIIGVPFVVAILTSVITLLMPNIYIAKTMIIPTDNDSGGMGAALMAQLGGLAGLAGGAIGTKSTGALYVTMLKSETLKDPVIDKFKLMELYKSKLRSTVYTALDGATNVSLGKTDGVITITVSNKDPKLAADLANEYVEQLGRLTAKLNMAGASANRVFIEKRIAEAKADLSKAEEHLKEFQTKHKTISVPDQAKATIEGVAQLRGQLATKEVELGTLQRQFTDNSQEVKTAKSAVASIRAQIAGLEGKGGVNSSSIPNLGSVPQLGQEYLRLMRDFKIQEAVFEMLTKQYEMAQINETKDTAPFQLLEKAKAPERKSKPKRSQIVILAAVTSGFIMVFLAFILQYLEQMPAEDKARLHQLKDCFAGIAGRFKSRKTV
jgi:uncharacterized protein involved in exopolysaccharide biosynthesis